MNKQDDKDENVENNLQNKSCENNLNSKEFAESEEDTINDSESKDSKSEDKNFELDLETVNKELLKKLEDSEKNSKNYFERLQRSMADFDNFRKRTISEKASMYSNGVRDTIEKLLPILDNFERAVETSVDKENSLYTGIEMILKQFKEFMKSMEVEEIKAVGEKFDPNFHNAVMHIDDENYGESEVIEQLQKGYKYKDKVIRPSMVKVAN